MINRCINSLNDTKVSILLILIVVFISYWQILFLNIWQDDNALIFKVEHFTEAAGVFGLGAFGAGPYRYIALPFIPVEHFFGDNLIAYYSLCLVFYTLAALSVYFLGRVLFKSKLIATFSSLIFAAGFVGLEGVSRLFNSIQTSYSIALTCLMFALLYIFCQKKIIWSYLLAIPLFYLTIETGYVRTQYIMLPVAVLFILYAWQKQKILDKLKNLIFLFPFILIYYYQYFSSPDPRSSSIKELLVNLSSGKFEYLYGLFGSIGSLFVNPYLSDLLFSVSRGVSNNPYHQLLFIGLSIILILLIIVFKTRRFFLLLPLSIIWLFLQRPIFQKSELISIVSTEIHTKTLFSTFVGGEIILIFLFYIISLKEKDKKLMVLFFLSWAIGNVLAYSFYLPLNPLETTSRYLTHSLAPLSLLIGVIFLFNLKNKISIPQKRNIFFVIFLILVSIFSTNIFLFNFRENISIPTKKFYSQLKKYLPSFDKGEIFYFDVSEDPLVRQRFKDFFSVGSMPDSTAIAIRYGVDRYDFFLTESFDELSTKIKLKEDLKKVKTFYFDGSNLLDTTNEFLNFTLNSPVVNIPLQSIKGNSDSIVYDTFDTKTEFRVDGKQTIGSSPEVSIETDASSIIPAKLSFDMKLDLLSPSLPYKNSGSDLIPEINDKILYYKYLDYLQEFRKTVDISSRSIWRNNSVSNLVDGRNDSIWWGDRGYWDSFVRKIINDPEYLLLDTHKISKISGITYVTNRLQTTPTEYKIFVSKDLQKWDLISTIKRPLSHDKSRIVDLFSPMDARFIKIEFYKTVMNDSPDMSEIAVIPSGFEKLNFDLLENLINNPFFEILNNEELQAAMHYISQYGKIKLFWRTINDSTQDSWKFREIPVIADGLFHSYSVEIPAGGSKFAEFTLKEINFPVDLKLKNVRIDYISPVKI